MSLWVFNDCNIVFNEFLNCLNQVIVVLGDDLVEKFVKSLGLVRVMVFEHLADGEVLVGPHF